MSLLTTLITFKSGKLYNSYSSGIGHLWPDLDGAGHGPGLGCCLWIVSSKAEKLSAQKRNWKRKWLLITIDPANNYAENLGYGGNFGNMWY